MRRLANLDKETLPSQADLDNAHTTGPSPPLRHLPVRLRTAALEQFGFVAAEDLRVVARARRVQRLDERAETRSRHEQVSRGLAAGVAERVRCPARRKHGLAGAGDA